MRLVVEERGPGGKWRARREVDTGPILLEEIPFEAAAGVAARLLSARIGRVVDELLAERDPPQRRSSKPTEPPVVEPLIERIGAPPQQPLGYDKLGRVDAYQDRDEPAPRPERPKRGLWSRHKDNPGQAIVEMALTLPVLLFILLGFTEVGFLFAARDGYQNGVDVLTELAAADRSDSWRAKVGSEDDRVRCHGAQPDVVYPDGGQAPGSRIQLVWTCHYHPLFVPMLAVPVAVQSEAVIAGAEPSPMPSPSASP